MNCENCGAPMRLVHDQDYYVCDYCGAYFHPAPNLDGVRVLGKPTEDACPICNIALVTASIDDNPIAYCPNCRGILVSQVVLTFGLQYLRKKSNRKLPPQRLDKQELNRVLQCPHCHRMMNTHPYGGPGNIVIENCADCRLVWLDYGELNRILNAPGEDRKNEDEE